ncbi:MAG: hypothetical protein R3C68_17675 [Myxococcota bacterium]
MLEAQKPVTFLDIDASRLNLTATTPRTLAEISENDAGILVGPKAAELSRLKRLFPQRVSDAVALPFGAFVEHVDRILPGEEDNLTLGAPYGGLSKSSPVVRSAARCFLAR